MTSRLIASTSGGSLPWLWLGAASMVGLGARLASSPGLDALFSLLLLLFALAAFVWPWYGLLALFPLLFALPSVPASVGRDEAAFALLCAAVFVRPLLQEWRSPRLAARPRWMDAVALALLLLLLLNFGVARSNGVPLADWLRGAVPFVFLALCLPIALLLSQDRDRLPVLGASLLVLTLLICGLVLYVVATELRVDPYWWFVIEDGRRIEVRPLPTGILPEGVYGPGLRRPSNVDLQANDSALPLGLAAGFTLCVRSRSSRGLALGGALALFALLALLSTHTRAMLLCAVLVIAAVGLWLLVFDRSRLLRALLVLVVLVGAGAAYLAVSGLDASWRGRLGGLVAATEQGAEGIARGGPDEGARALDEAAPWAATTESEPITIRLEEYRKAWQLFAAQPLTGAGLGIKQRMVYTLEKGEPLVREAAYIHNWVLYALMVAGLPGLLLYGFLLLAPAPLYLLELRRFRESSAEGPRDLYDLAGHLLCAALLTMVLHGLLFAVFRLITFNLMLAVALGLALHLGILNREERG